jgi:AGZA family xanthine/uracil permease-like MFS transporter
MVTVNDSRYRWAAPGDLNAFFGLMIDNLAGLVLCVGMLASSYGFPVDFALRYMVPGTAIGVLVGDLLFFWLAFRYAKQTGNSRVTAMPLGLDTPSTIGMVLFVLGPAYASAINAGMSETAAATEAWHIGICAIFITGLIKLMMAFGSNWVRNMFPRAGLLGSLTAIALALIAFTQMPKIAANPVVGFSSLVIVLVTFVARGRLPFRIPGALAAVVIGTMIWYSMIGIDWVLATRIVPVSEVDTDWVWFPIQWLEAFQLDWFAAMGKTVTYLPYIIPFAVATVIGGIDCAESAASVGDDFQTANVIGIEAVATVLAAFCGGVIQTTPYIGHPAYKAMGARAAYTLATALFVGGAGIIGYFGLIFQIIPEAAILPILIFIGIEITAQSFHATPKRHYAAVAIACLPALAKLVMIYLGQYALVIDYEAAIDAGRADIGQQHYLENQILLLNVLAGGFILTSLIWASATANIIDRRFFSASIFFAIGGMLILFGVMHSPLNGDKMFVPWNLSDTQMFDAESKRVVVQFAVAYLVMAVLLFVIGKLVPQESIDDDQRFEALTACHDETAP